MKTGKLRALGMAVLFFACTLWNPAGIAAKLHMGHGLFWENLHGQSKGSA